VFRIAFSLSTNIKTPPVFFLFFFVQRFHLDTTKIHTHEMIVVVLTIITTFSFSLKNK